MRRGGAVIVAVFAKPARPGACKTRLIPALGAEGAAALAGAMLADTLALVRTRPWATPVLASTEPGDGVWPQGPGDLGDRLERVLRRAVDAEGAIALGADSPVLPVGRLDDARAALRHHPAALGPTDDGGFYLIALRTCPGGLLAGLPWSTPGTCDATAARLRQRLGSVAILDPWFDVDVPDDLARLDRALHEAPDAAPATRRLRAAQGR